MPYEFGSNPSIYRIYTSWDQLTGMDNFELFPGEFDGDRRTYRNRGSIFINEEGFRPFGPMVSAVSREFEWWGDVRLHGQQLHELSRWLNRFRTILAECRSAGDLTRRLSRSIYVDDATYLGVKSRLTRTVEEIDGVVLLASGRRHGLWVIGP